jgi:hypothetical protein
MINNITNVDPHMQQMGVAKSRQSLVSMPMPPILGFRTKLKKEKAELRVKKFRRSENIVIAGEIDDDYVDIVDEVQDGISEKSTFNFFQLNPEVKKTKFLKNCYVIDYIQSPVHRRGLGTEAIKGLVEKAMFDPKAEGRIVTFSSPVWKESSPAQFFYKLGFRFMDPEANRNIEECIIKKVPDTPPQIGMMYLPKHNLHKLLRYGDVF